MFKWIMWTVIIFWWIWYFSSSSSYIPLSKQIDVKTIQISNLDYLTKETSVCVWTCRNYSNATSSWGWGSYGWK